MSLKNETRPAKDKKVLCELPMLKAKQILSICKAYIMGGQTKTSNLYRNFLNRNREKP